MRYELTSRKIVLIAVAICLTGITGLFAGSAVSNAMRDPGFDRSAQSPEERFDLGRNAFVAPALLPPAKPVKLDYTRSGPGRVLQPFEPARKRERQIMAAYDADLYWSGYDITAPVHIRDYDASGPAYQEHYDNRDHVTDFDDTEFHRQGQPKPSAAITTEKPATPAISSAIAGITVISPKRIPQPTAMPSAGAKMRAETSRDQPAAPEG